MTKPPYTRPTMADVHAAPPNGLTVVSTFSGAGGTCLGFRLAGYRILAASEFVQAARETYAANFPETPIDPRDVRDVTADDLLERAGGPFDVLEGSPPCASFSTSGKRQATWGKSRRYSDREQRTDDLFDEYVRLVAGTRPRAFVAENVAGLTIGVARGYLVETIRKLEKAGYRVAARLLDAQWLGVPQVRRRVFLIGFRHDLDLEPAFPSPLPYRYTVRDALPHIVRQASPAKYGRAGWQDAGAFPSQTIGASPNTGNGRSPASVVESRLLHGAYSPSRSERGFEVAGDEPAPTIVAGVHSGGPHQFYVEADGVERRKLTIDELRALSGFPPDFRLTGRYAQQWERLGRSVPPPMARAVAEAVRDRLLALETRAAA